MDFPFGYPVGAGGEPIMPAGRGLCARLGAMIEDREDGSNNRFHVAGALNREIAPGRTAGDDAAGTTGPSDDALGAPDAPEPGPFWGCPARQAGPDLLATKPTMLKASGDLALGGASIPEYRIIERRLRSRGFQIQSAWKLYTTGSVGSQTLTGLACVDRLLRDPDIAHRGVLWPFETGWDEHPLARGYRTVVFAEIWPTLGDHESQPFQIKDARQVAAIRDWAIDQGDDLRRRLSRPRGLSDRNAELCRNAEGWILGSGDP
jgi:hypothetical protein